eukprot:jgi/Ulvmu1/177/UM001_0181.1
MGAPIRDYGTRHGSPQQATAQRRLEESQQCLHLHSTYLQGAADIMWQLPQLATLASESILPGVGTISGYTDAPNLPLYSGGQAKVSFVRAAIPGHHRVYQELLALKRFTSYEVGINAVLQQVDTEAAFICGAHAAVARTQPRLSPLAIPQQIPLIRITGLHSTPLPLHDDPSHTRPTADGLFTPAYTMSLEKYIRGGRMSVGDSLRVMQAMAVALHACEGPVAARQRRAAASAPPPLRRKPSLQQQQEPYLPGLHCDIKEANILVQVTADGDLAMPAQLRESAAWGLRPDPPVVLADAGIAIPPGDHERFHSYVRMTAFYRPPALALSDLVRARESIAEHAAAAAAAGEVLPPVGADLTLTPACDMHSLGVVCWRMLGGPSFPHSDLSELMRQIVRGTTHASGERSAVPARCAAPAVAMFRWLTAAHPAPESVLSMLCETLGEAAANGCWGEISEASLGDGEWPAGAMPMALLEKTARIARTCARRGSARDRLVAEAACMRPGELLNLAGVGDLIPGDSKALAGVRRQGVSEAQSGVGALLDTRGAWPSPQIPQKGSDDLALPDDVLCALWEKFGIEATRTLTPVELALRAQRQAAAQQRAAVRWPGEALEPLWPEAGPGNAWAGVVRGLTLSASPLEPVAAFVGERGPQHALHCSPSWQSSPAGSMYDSLSYGSHSAGDALTLMPSMTGFAAVCGGGGGGGGGEGRRGAPCRLDLSDAAFDIYQSVPAGGVAQQEAGRGEAGVSTAGSAEDCTACCAVGAVPAAAHSSGGEGSCQLGPGRVTFGGFIGADDQTEEPAEHDEPAEHEERAAAKDAVVTAVPTPQPASAPKQQSHSGTAPLAAAAAGAGADSGRLIGSCPGELPRDGGLVVHSTSGAGSALAPTVTVADDPKGSLADSVEVPAVSARWQTRGRLMLRLREALRVRHWSRPEPAVSDVTLPSKPRAVVNDGGAVEGPRSGAQRMLGRLVLCRSLRVRA